MVNKVVPGEIHQAEGQFEHLRQLYELGDKTALYDAVTVSNQCRIGLPDWAAEDLKQLVLEKWKGKLKTWEGTRKPLNSGYKMLLANYVRTKVMRSVLAFLADNKNYKQMPTRCVEEYQANGLKRFLSADEPEVAIANFAMSKTAFGAIGSKYYKQQRDFPPDEAAIDDAENEVELQWGDGFQELTKQEIVDQLTEQKLLPLEFGYRESEELFKLRPPGQFWGPPSEE